MIDISIIGGKQKERDLIHSLANFCVKKLMPRKKNLEIIKSWHGDIQMYGLHSN